MKKDETRFASINADAVHIPEPAPGGLDPDSILEAFAHRMKYSVAKNIYTATHLDIYLGLAFAVRDRLMERWFETQSTYYENDAKRVYYLSLEFLMGRALKNNIHALEALPAYKTAVERMGLSLDNIEEDEMDAGLGNGGLGRLAACFLDSAATLGLPFYGYGIRYDYGIFRQRIDNGFQVEAPDSWLRYGNPWEIARADSVFTVKFYGRTHHYIDADGVGRLEWIETEDLQAMAYDMPIVGYGNDTVNSLRLWAAKSNREFDLEKFNSGDYVRAVEDKTESENISKVLYPADDKYVGKELRLKQQYFFVSATLQDLIRRFMKKPARKWEELPDKVAVQLNDTHPAIAIPELMRLLVDQYRLEWDFAWDLVKQVFAFTNHTVLPEAMEAWSTEMFGHLLPRHLEIIREIDRRFRIQVREAFPADPEKENRTAIITSSDQPHVRMANLAIVGSHSVNGVAELHTRILKEMVFRDFDEIFPGKLNNKTNGITPRRWLLKSNPRLASLITEAIGEGWIRDLDELRKLEPFAADSAFREKWATVKSANKQDFATWMAKRQSLTIDPNSLFDFQVKRIHEYKRQLLNILHVIALYNRIRSGEALPVPRSIFFAGKAAPSYFIAKLIIKLMHAVAEMVAADPVVKKQLLVGFIENYSVSAAERIFPACELSEQISTAGTEASGTGNMKAALNGALTIGTLDGANVEIREEVGESNIFIFGNTTEEIASLRASGTPSSMFIERSRELAEVISILSSDLLPDGSAGLFKPIIEILTTNDRYFHCADFDSYVSCQRSAGQTFTDVEKWQTMSIHNVAGMGKFSSDRSIRQYTDEIWKAQSYRIKMRSPSAKPEAGGRGPG